MPGEPIAFGEAGVPVTVDGLDGNGGLTRRVRPALYRSHHPAVLDAKADRKAGTLTVHALHEDVRFTNAIRSDVEAEIEALAAWLALRITRT